MEALDRKGDHEKEEIEMQAMKRLITRVAVDGVAVAVLFGGSSLAGTAKAINPAQTTVQGVVNYEYWDLEAFWKPLLGYYGRSYSQYGRSYSQPKVKYYDYNGRMIDLSTPCGSTATQYGSQGFYCPGSQTIYMDYNQQVNDLRQFGDGSVGFWLAHEFGYHIQKLAGLSPLRRPLRVEALVVRIRQRDSWGVMARQPSGTVTFLFTDIEGSTRLLAELGQDRYSGALDAHREVLRAAFERHGGYEVDCEGDAFFVAFESATEALAAAAEAQRGLAAHAWPDGHEVRVRIGLHTGEPLLAPPKYVGLDVHRAARLTAAGHGGQVLVSAATQALVGEDGLRDLGEHRFKDLAAPERVYQLGASEFPPLRSLYRTNVPTAPTPFLGRERELTEATALLAREDVRLLTLSGPGGTGKTRLAMQAAASTAERFPEGIWWVPLAPLTDASLVVPTAAQVMDAKRDLAQHIADKRLLLVFDNFEHVIEAAPELSTVLEACPNLTVLVTSRERLQLGGEHEYAVPPLAPPDGVALFHARTEALGSTFDANGPVRELCDRLDNLPLALELAAARTKLFTPTQLLERLGQRLDLFKGGRDADPRQRTLRATIEWSYDLLTRDEKVLFARLSVFAGGCTLDASDAICDADPDTLQSLLEKSLIRRSDGRFWMFETVREYARERLDETADAHTLYVRHADYFVREVREAEPKLRTREQADALAWLRQEIGNVRSALDFLETERDPNGQATLAGSLWYFWYLSGQFREGRARLDAAIQRSSELEANAIATLHDGLCCMNARLGNVREASAHAEASLRRRRATDDRRGLLRSLLNAGAVADLAGDTKQMVSYHEECAALAARLGDQWFLALVRVNLGFLALADGEPARARELLRQGVDAMSSLGDREHERRAAAGLALAEVELGLREEALDRYRDMLVKEGGDIGLEWFILCLEGIAAAQAQTDAEQAARVLGAAESFRRSIGWARDPDEQRLHERTIAIITRSLTATMLEEALNTGRSLAPEEALDLGLLVASQRSPV